MFCKTVWNGIHILNDGYIRLCSIGQNTDRSLDLQRARDVNGNVMHILTHSIEDIMNSTVHRNIRKLNQVDPTAWSPHCECCKNREIVASDTPNISRRIYLMDIDTPVTRPEMEDRIKEDGSIDWMPNSLDVRFGNLCNQKCIMCDPNSSNLWYDEYVDYYKTTVTIKSVPAHIIRDVRTNRLVSHPGLFWHQTPAWWEKFAQMAPHLKHIYITGGEPMVVPAHDEMLDKLIEGGYAKDIWLEYDTNCSVMNKKLVDRWMHFKKVHIRASMDAINEQYEVIRFPGKWEKFKENILKFKECEVRSNGRIKVKAATACFQMTTAFSIIESEEWCKSIGIPYHIRFLEGPVHHAVASLSDVAKQELIDYFSEYLETSEKAPIIIKHLQRHMGKEFHLPNAVQEFSKFMDYLDTTRGTDWRTTFPKVVPLLSI